MVMMSGLELLVALLSFASSSVQGLTSDTSLSSLCTYERDGMCDTYNNNAECNYDGGDCCECDCVDADYICGLVGYACIDPGSTCQMAPTPAPTASQCLSGGDGWCDASNNNPECNYDDGDCCECDCVDGSWTCGVNDFVCIDPASTCQTAPTLAPAAPTPAPTPFVVTTGCLQEGDGWCDSSNNNAECNYDGGDCCECDCEDALYNCGDSGFTCFDPDSTCLYHHYYDDDGSSTGSDATVVTDDDGGDDDDGPSTSGGGTVVTDDDGGGDTAVPDDDDGSDEGNGTGGPIPIDNDDNDDNGGTNAANDDDAVERSGTETDGDGDGGDGAPVEIIVGGAVGGAVFVGAVVILACCLKTGRLKGCKCCGSSTPAAAKVPPSAEGPAPAAVRAEEGGAPTVDAAAALPPPHPSCPPPAYAYHDHSLGSATKVEAYPVAATRSPPPAYEG